jgi:hypothetical protein
MLVEIAVGLIGVAGLLALGRLTFILFYGWVAIAVDKHREDSAD